MVKVKYYLDNLIVNDELSNGAALVTGWIKAPDVVAQLTNEQRDKLMIVGDLVSTNGIAYMIANLYLNPQINHLFVLDPEHFRNTEFGKPIQALKDIFEGGDIDYLSSLIDYESSSNEESLLTDFVTYFKDHVTFVSQKDLGKSLEDFEHNGSDWTEEKQVTIKSVQLDSEFASEEMGFLVHSETITDAYHKVLYLLYRYGVEKGSNYGEQQKELPSVHVVLRNIHIASAKKELIEGFGLTNQEIDEYANSLLYGNVPDGLAYTYGQRLNALPPDGVSQLDYIVDTLREHPNSRQATAVLWNPEIDTKGSEVPCFTMLDAKIQENKLYLKVVFRSNDMFGGWPKNVAGVLKIQEVLCERLKIKPGMVETTAISAHVYERDFPMMKEILEQTYPEFLGLKQETDKTVSLKNDDPRGIFEVETKNGIIKVSLFHKNGDLMNVFIGDTAEELRDELVPFVTDSSTLFELGVQTQEAEFLKQFSIPYHYPRMKESEKQRNMCLSASSMEYVPLPSEDMGFSFHGDSISQVWSQLLNSVLRYGKIRRTDDSQLVFESLSTHAVVKRNSSSMSDIEQLNSEMDSLELNRFKTILTDGRTQLQYVIDTLVEDPNSRQAVVVFQNPSEDVRQDHVPSITMLEAVIQNNKLYLAAVLRSNDIYRYFPKNARSIELIQDYLCDRINCSRDDSNQLIPGSFELTSDSAHIYYDDYHLALSVIEKHPPVYCRPDPRGMFLVQSNESGLQMDLKHPDGSLELSMKGKNPLDFRDFVATHAQNPSHIYYAGQELAKASFTKRCGLSYIQDKTYHFPKELKNRPNVKIKKSSR